LGIISINFAAKVMLLLKGEVKFEKE